MKKLTNNIFNNQKKNYNFARRKKRVDMSVLIRKILTLFIVLTYQLLIASPDEVKTLTVQDETALKQKEHKEFIQHHVLDSHDFTFITDEKEKHYVGFPLPVILFDDGKLVTFMSSEFHHGEKIVEKNGTFYKLYHGKIYKTDATGDLKINPKNHHPEVPKVLDFSITKNVFSIFIAAILLFIFFTGLAKSYTKSEVPTGFGRFLEPIVLYVRDDIAKPNIGERKYRNFMGYLLTVFFFILILNLLGMTPFGINVTGNITITFFLAVMTYLITQFSGNLDYWKHIFWMPGVPVPIKILMIPIEIIGTLTKPFALMIRLFANMTAGHIVIMSLISLIYIFPKVISIPSFSFLTLFIYILELLVAFLQAYIFTMLSSLFIGSAVAEHHHDDHH
jgi:F-type H+-transporting ATPase subunit a